MKLKIRPQCIYCMPENLLVMSFTLGTQCDPDPLLQENFALKSELRRLQGHKWSVKKIKDYDAKTKFYTGLPSFAVFMWFFK